MRLGDSCNPTVDNLDGAGGQRSIRQDRSRISQSQ
jgi:hypothetical protein